MTAITPLHQSALSPRLRITARGRAVVALLVAAPLAFGAVALGLGQGAAASTSGAAANTSSGTGASSGGADASSGGADAPGTSTASSGFRWITVGQGDSLWSIAQRVAPGEDPRQVIADIIDLNQLASASVSSGDRIALPLRYGR